MVLPRLPLWTAAQLNARAVRHTRFMNRQNRLQLWRKSSCAVVWAVCACWISARPGKVSGPLASAADSIKTRAGQLTCVGPVDCSGTFNDTLAYYLSREDGWVEVVAREWAIDVDRLRQTTDSMMAALTTRYGPAKRCQLRSYETTQVWVWSSPARIFLLTWETPPDPSPFYISLRFVEMLPDQPCNRFTEPPRFG